jgi:hypothetical protein
LLGAFPVFSNLYKFPALVPLVPSTPSALIPVFVLPIHQYPPLIYGVNPSLPFVPFVPGVPCGPCGPCGPGSPSLPGAPSTPSALIPVLVVPIYQYPFLISGDIPLLPSFPSTPFLPSVPFLPSIPFLPS